MTAEKPPSLQWLEQGFYGLNISTAGPNADSLRGENYIFHFGVHVSMVLLISLLRFLQVS